MIFYSIHFNRPDFIEIQKKCVERLGGFLVVINNHSNKQISDNCENLGVKFFDYDPGINECPSNSHGHALNYTRSIIDYSDDWCIMDHDFFPLRKISFDDFDIIGLPQFGRGGIKYLWPGFIAGNKKTSIKDINFSPEVGSDTGVGTAYLVENYKVKFLNQSLLGETTTPNIQTSPIISDFDGFGIHYVNGSNWMHTSGDVSNDKKNKLLEIIGS